MRIGILTFHRAHNYGAVLQCYALQEILKGMGHDVYVIDYRQPIIEQTYKVYRTSWIIKKLLKPWKIPPYLRMMKRDWCFRQFRKHYLRLTEKCDAKHIPEDFDYYIHGSDQLWNSLLTGICLDKVYTGEYKHKDSSALISYAISLNQKSMKLTSQNEWEAVLSNFKYISLREQNMAKEMGRMTNREISTCIDPTLLTNKSLWNNILNNTSVEPNCVVLYQIRGNQEVHKKIKSIAQELADYYKTKLIDLSSFDYKVEDWVSYISKARCVVTTSFHGCVFATIFQRPLCAFKVHDEGDNRYLELLSLMGIEHCVYEYDTFNIETCDIEYTLDLERIRQQQLFSLNYLSSSLKN